MQNLLPFLEKKKYRREYRLRLGIVSVFAVGALVGASTALLVPSYVLSVLKMKYAADEVARLEAKEKRTEQEKEIDTQIKDINRKIDTYLKAGRSGQSRVSEVIQKIVAIKGDTIKLTNISYEPSATTERVVLVGIAGDREALALFTEVLRKDGGFTTVNLPISSYVKSKNIGFSVVLERATQPKK